MYQELIEKLEIKIGDIPVKVFRPEKYARNRKTIIHYHGWTSSVEKQELLGEIIASKGYQVIMPELVNHGQRGDNNFSNLELLAETIIQTVAEFRDIKSLAVERLNGDPENLVVSGHSMGGMVAGSILSIDPSIKLGMLFNTLLDFDAFKDLEYDFDENLLETLMLFNPKERLENFNQRHIIFFTGERDDIISPEEIEKFKKVLVDRNVNIENMEFLKYPDTAHAIAYKMLRDAIEIIYNKIGRTEYPNCCNNL